MKPAKSSSSHIYLLLGSFLLALAFRLIRLGFWPLQHFEAEIALQALAASEGLRRSLGPHMAVVGLTAFDFFIFSSSNFLARFWTALIGSLVVLIPFLFREHLGKRTAIWISFLLAISPEMVGLSRISGSPMVAMVCLLLGLAFISRQKPILAGAMLALGLMGGPGFWFGVVILGISVILSSRFFNLKSLFNLHHIINPSQFWLRLGISFSVVVILIGTSFFLAPAGLSGVFSGLFDFLKGFSEPYTTPFFLLPLTLLAYTSPALLLGLWGSLRGVMNRNYLDSILTIWWLAGLVFIFLYPGSQPADMIWVTLPLWVLSLRVLMVHLKLPDSSWLVFTGTILMVIVVSAFIMLSVRTIVRPSLSQDQQLNALIAIVGGMILMVAFILLVNFGWSFEMAFSGFLSGLLIVFCALLISLSVTTTGLAPELSHELWYPDEPYLSSQWLRVSLDRALGWNKKRDTPLEIAVVDLDTPGMRWILRDDLDVQFLPYIPPASRPGILITDEFGNPELTESYRGQDLVWARNTQWENMTTFQYLNWLITREVPTTTQQIIFWLRTDLMPDDQF